MLEIKNLVKSYQTMTTKYEVLKNLSFQIEKGEFVGVMGASGSGKTTLLNCISCFVPFESGEILLSGQNVAKLSQDELAKIRNEKLGFVFQDFMLLDGLSIFENICLPQIIAEKPIEAMKARAENLCETFGITHIKDKYPSEISGGEKQRTAIARSLINEPYVILADEPTGNLDSKSSRGVIETFIKAKSELGATIFMVTHDSFSASFCDRVLVLKDGQIYKDLKQNGNREDFLDKLLDTIKEISGEES